MDGLFIDDRRPASKKEVREVAATAPERITVERTSFFYTGPNPQPLTSFEERIAFVGPNPHTARNFYGTLAHTPKGWTVK